MRHRSHSASVHTLLLALLCGALTGCTGKVPDSDKEVTLFRNTKADIAFVGDAACFDCHESQWQGFQSHGMSRSFYPMSKDREVEDFSAEPVYHEASDYYYRPLVRGGEYFQEEFRVDDAGMKVHSLIRKIDFVLGSGNAARTYITKSNNRLYQLPLTWYNQGKGWALSPGYDRHNVRFGRLLTDRCIACHNSYPMPVPHVPGKFTDVPDGIGCERCHGPGALHVGERLEELNPPDSIDTSIVNPAHLSLTGQLDVCQQCHVTGAVTVFGEGRNAFAYRPGEPLASHVAIFEEKVPTPQNIISVVSHADRLKLSACFREFLLQNNPMTCVTCHDPHNGFREQGPAYFNDKCLSCHTDIPGRYSEEPALANHRRDTNCFTCHMPRVEAQNAPHASFTDHWIRVVTKSDSTEYAASVAGPELVPLLKENADLNAAARDLGLAHIILGEQKAGEASIVRGISILDTTLTVDPSHGEAQFLYGRALLKIGRIGAAIDALELANKLDARIPERLQELGWAYEIDDRATSLSETLYEEALSIQPQNAEIRVRLAELLEADNRLEAALTEYVKAADEQPWLESAHYGLGTTAFALGRLAQAESAFREVLRLNPDFANALTNLGAIMILEKNLDEAMGLFERAVAVEPINVAALGNLGLVYAQLGRYREARDRLQQVLLLAPEDQQARAALAEVRRLMQ